MVSRKKVCVITGTRADYGLLRWVIDGIKNSNLLDLQLIATGMHLSPEFGMTVDQIKLDGYPIMREVEILLSSDTPAGISKSIGIGLISFADIFYDLKPDLILLLGDRFEILSASIAAMINKIPIAHLHGGELTEGLIDESIRHSITKMSQLHFVASEEYKKRVIQLGENEKFIFNVGGLGIDNIKNLKLLKKAQLENELNLKFAKKNLLITYHPVTLETGTNQIQISELINALKKFKDINLIFTMPNADTEGRVIMNTIKKFCSVQKNAIFFTSLGELRYLSCIRYVDGVVGNSSSGLLEVPSFKKGTVNIGDRQKGRLMASSVINCEPNQEDIIKGIEILYSQDYQEKLKNTINPYGNGGASKKIVKKIENLTLNEAILKKEFNDIDF